MYKYLLKPLLFRMDAEKAHYFTVGLLKFIFMLPFVRSIFYGLYNINHPSLEREVFGIRFKNPVGLAAGFDKDGRLINQLAFAGFGFIEVGTVTPKSQPGNEKPRLFRLPEDKALINRMGFNNSGVQSLQKRLESRYASIVIGGNIGKNKVTPNEEAIHDYVACFEALYFDVDYFAVNVSSPNTPNLRALQDKEPLKKILNKLVEINKTKPKQKPILLKIAPDLSDEQLDDIIEIVEETGISGIIATNTTISRDGLKTDSKRIKEIGAGGLSGSPVRDRSTEVIRYLAEKSNYSFPIIGVGGIGSPQDAIEKLEAGASLVQIYTGYIYEGPGLVKQINKELISHAQNH